MHPVGETRQQLADLQQKLILSLQGKEAPPHGFDPKKLKAAANALVLKRTHSVARCWPELTRAFGSQFADRFAAYVAEHPLLRSDSPLADGRNFAEWIHEELPLAGRLTTIRFDLRFARRGNSFVQRRGPKLTCRLCRREKKIIIAFRLSRYCEKIVCLRTPAFLHHFNSCSEPER